MTLTNEIDLLAPHDKLGPVGVIQKRRRWQRWKSRGQFKMHLLGAIVAVIGGFGASDLLQLVWEKCCVFLHKLNHSFKIPGLFSIAYGCCFQWKVVHKNHGGEKGKLVDHVLIAIQVREGEV